MTPAVVRCRRFEFDIDIELHHTGTSATERQLRTFLKYGTCAFAFRVTWQSKRHLLEPLIREKICEKLLRRPMPCIQTRIWKVRENKWTKFNIGWSGNHYSCCISISAGLLRSLSDYPTHVMHQTALLSHCSNFFRCAFLQQSYLSLVCRRNIHRRHFVIRPSIISANLRREKYDHTLAKRSIKQFRRIIK